MLRPQLLNIRIWGRRRKLRVRLIGWGRIFLGRSLTGRFFGGRGDIAGDWAGVGGYRGGDRHERGHGGGVCGGADGRGADAGCGCALRSAVYLAGDSDARGTVPQAAIWLGANWLKGVVSNPNQWANVLVLLVGIGAVSWLTMARVVRGQVMSLREQPFHGGGAGGGSGSLADIDAALVAEFGRADFGVCDADGAGGDFKRIVLSFLGLGIQAPLPSWGNLASQGVDAAPTRWRFIGG